MRSVITSFVVFTAFTNAWAQEPNPPVDEVVVVGELQVQQARDALTRRVLDLGYRRTRKEGVFRPPSSWMGKLTIYPDGTLEFSRAMLAFGSENDQREVGTDQTPGIEQQPQLQGGVPLHIRPSSRKLAPIRAKVLEQTEPERKEIRRLMVQQDVQRVQATLADRLDALMDDGTPLRLGEIRVPPEERLPIATAWCDAQSYGPAGDAARAICEPWLAERSPSE